VRRYEMMLLIRDTVDEEGAQAIVTKAKDVLAEQGGTLLEEAWWGRRKLSYEIDHRDHGFYAVLDFHATAEAVAEVERQLKLSDDVIRTKTVRPEIRSRSHA